MQNSPSPWLLPLLREKTRDLHERLEQRLNLPDSLDSREEYARLLAAFYGFYAPIEKFLTEHPGLREDTGLCFSSRRKSGYLETDLRFLGFGDCALKQIPRCTVLPAMNSTASAIGCAYVLEGATLGGQIIGRHLETRLGLHRGAGVAFFYCYGDATAAMWQQFRRGAEAFAEREAAAGQAEPVAREATVAARATFERLEAWILQ